MLTRSERVVLFSRDLLDLDWQIRLALPDDGKSLAFLRHRDPQPVEHSCTHDEAYNASLMHARDRYREEQIMKVRRLSYYQQHKMGCGITSLWIWCVDQIKRHTEVKNDVITDPSGSSRHDGSWLVISWMLFFVSFLLLVFFKQQLHATSNHRVTGAPSMTLHKAFLQLPAIYRETQVSDDTSEESKGVR